MKKNILLVILLVGFSLTYAQSIYEIQGQAAASPYKGQTVTTKGIVTAVYSNSYFIQDGDGAWSGLYIYDQTNKPALGDSIQLTGLVDEYYDMTELKTITEFTILSSANVLPEPILISTGNDKEQWESVLIKVNNAVCTNIDLGYGEWEVNDGSGPVVVNDLGYAYSPILGVAYAIAGPLEYSFSFFKIEPRFADDIVQDLALYFVENPKPENIAQTSFDLSWETNENASAYVEYGLSTSFEMGKVFSTASSTTQTLSLNNLSAGEIYYAKCYAVNSTNDTTPIYTGVYATQSESSGIIKTYFTNPPVKILTKDAKGEDIVDTIIFYIDKATSTIDIALYDLTNFAPQSDSSNYRIIQALNKQFDKGVAIRFISDVAALNPALDSLKPSIPVLKGNTEGIMHNKFLIIDAQVASNAWLISGSTNWTYNNLYMDFNNMICIQDQSLAKAYVLEFNEMWGSDGMISNANNAKFGPDKTDNTPHYFNINNTAVKLYFSPSDHTTQEIAGAIEMAESTIDFAMMAFTEDVLGNAIVAAHNRDVSVDGIIDYIEYSGSEFDYLNNSGVEVYDYTNPDGSSWPDGTTLHHKFCVIDAQGTNPLVVTGTHNWTASAESKNDENTLFIYNNEVANAFTHEFDKIKTLILGSSIKQNLSLDCTIYPNPSNGALQIQFPENGTYHINVFDLSGTLIQNLQITGMSGNLKIQKQGLFLVKIYNNKNQITKKVSIY
jgi:hypothetical protein